MRFTEGLWEPKTNGMEHEVYKNSPSGVHNGHYVEARSSPNSAEEHVMPIAIVGMSCRFPGGATNPSKLWDMLANAQSGWSKIPANRFTQESFHHPSTEVGGTVRGPRGISMPFAKQCFYSSTPEVVIFWKRTFLSLMRHSSVLVRRKQMSEFPDISNVPDKSSNRSTSRHLIRRYDYSWNRHMKPLKMVRRRSRTEVLH